MMVVRDGDVEDTKSTGSYSSTAAGAKQLNAVRSGEWPLSHGQHWSRGGNHGLVVIFHVVPKADGATRDVTTSC